MSKFCVLDCDDAKAWKERPFGEMFRVLLSEPEDTWDVIHIARGEAFPDSISTYHGVVITGSRHNCRDSDDIPWFETLCSIIREIHEKGSPRLYGGCFGCQVIAHALGGEVDRNPGDDFILKAEAVVPLTDICETLSVTVPSSIPRGEAATDATAGDQSELLLLESHGDCVVRLPPGARLLATSPSCTNEIFCAGNGSSPHILACQSHPEFDLHYCIYERIWPRVVGQLGRLSEKQVPLYERSLQQYSRDRGADLLTSIIKEFLHKND